MGIKENFLTIYTALFQAEVGDVLKALTVPA